LILEEAPFRIIFANFYINKNYYRNRSFQMNLRLEVSLSFEIENPKLKTILKTVKTILPVILNQLFNVILLAFAESYMGRKNKPICCDKCGDSANFIWKTKHGKLTRLKSIFCILFLHQLQWQCKHCNHKFFITRKLLGIEPRKVIPYEMTRKLGLMGALASFRVSRKIALMCGCAINKMTIWRSVQKIGKETQFDLDPKECSSGEADGTGIPIKGIKKRGKEMKVMIQHKKRGGVRIAALSIGGYDQDWGKLFAPLLKTMNQFKEFVLVTDGDTSILKGLKAKVKIIIQRCLWHIPHQLKYTLWKDKAIRKSKAWLHVLSAVIDICSTWKLIEEPKLIETLIQKKEKKLERLIAYCRKNNYNASAVYLRNAKPDMFSALREKYSHKTTSKVERVMRTINLRINNRGKWSADGALNATKIRLAYYYNGFDA
jgi:hypothetical protein